MTPELKAAVERWRVKDYWTQLDTKPKPPTKMDEHEDLSDADEHASIDKTDLANAYIAHLDAQAAREAVVIDPEKPLPGYDDLLAYANRLNERDLEDYQGPTGDDADMRAGIVLALNFLIQNAKAAAREAERALPIDEAWLISIRAENEFGIWRCGGYPFVCLNPADCDAGYYLIEINGISIEHTITTRGQLLDLLSALGVEVAK